MKTRALLFLVLPAIMLSCQQEADSEQGLSASNSADTTLIDVDETLFDATLTRISTESMRDIKGEGGGPTVWDRLGSLGFVLTELYGSPVELEANPYEGDTFSLDLAWRKDTSLDEIRAEVAQHVQDALGYSVQTDTRTRQEHRLSITDTTGLLTAADTDFVNEGTLSQVSKENGNWRIYGDLEKLAEVFRQETDSLAVAAADEDSTAYYYEFTDAGNFENLVNQLQSNYGVTVGEHPVEVTYRTIRFGNDD